MVLSSDGKNPELTADHIQIGEIVKPHGIRGEVKVYVYSERPENFRTYKKVVLQDKGGSGAEIYKIIKSREHGKLAILQLDGITTREAAADLQGNTVWLPKDDFQKLDSEEYYWHQLEGLAVITESGRELGKVARLFSTQAHDILVVAGTGHEYMVPVTADIIRSIDELEGKLVIAPPPGLLEINE